MSADDDQPVWRDGARLSVTVKALMARGVDSEKAGKLYQEGWTFGRIQQATESDLVALGLTPHAIKQIRSSPRPPIPFPTLAAVLFANRFTCCVCRTHGKSVVVHHINEWSKSHDHAASNLAVVCLDDHDRAHMKGGLSQNLSPDLLAGFKSKWEAAAAKLDARTILDATTFRSDTWWYFNHTRVLELGRQTKTKLTATTGFAQARQKEIITAQGELQDIPTNTAWMYAGVNGLTLSAYMEGVVRGILLRVPVCNVSDDLDRGALVNMIQPGDLIFVQGRWIFSTASNDASRHDGPGQTFKGKRRANGVEITFTADRWEATSCSTWSDWLHGTQSCGCLLRVIELDNSTQRLLRVRTTTLGICAPLGGLKVREYASPQYRRDTWMTEEEDDTDKPIFDLDSEL